MRYSPPTLNPVLSDLSLTHVTTDAIAMSNYFNTLSLREQLEQLGKCRFMHLDEFTDGTSALKGKKMVVQEYLLRYLLEDENKHNHMLDLLAIIKKGMYPYG